MREFFAIIPILSEVKIKNLWKTFLMLSFVNSGQNPKSMKLGFLIFCCFLNDFQKSSFFRFFESKNVFWLFPKKTVFFGHLGPRFFYFGKLIYFWNRSSSPRSGFSSKSVEFKFWAFFHYAISPNRREESQLRLVFSS